MEFEFPRYVGDDPMEWLNRVDQFFEYQCTIEKEEEREIIWANSIANVEGETREELEDNVSKGQCYLRGWSYVIVSSKRTLRTWFTCKTEVLISHELNKPHKSLGDNNIYNEAVLVFNLKSHCWFLVSCISFVPVSC